MSSREIAELVGKRHDNVIAAIEKMLDTLKVGRLKFKSSYLTLQNKRAKEYLLPRRECEILVTGYDVVRRAAVIDRWMQLEKEKQQAQQAQQVIPTSTGNAVLDALIQTLV
ncbi:Rha family transcriptional regulator [Endozoicomonas sp. ALD040]|uniref:Rha family transcriptional regulator n=1 Tax=Endozoicomonas sp. ALD040 TaxID=3403079 RepID=UPI003BB135FD